MGDMDFKIAGSRLGVTAIQLDVKLPGVPLHILCEALAPAQHARCQILDCMEAEIAEPRKEKRDDAPRFGERPAVPLLLTSAGYRSRSRRKQQRKGWGVVPLFLHFSTPYVWLPGFGFPVLMESRPE